MTEHVQIRKKRGLKILHEHILHGLLCPLLLGMTLVCETVVARDGTASKHDYWVPVAPPRAHYTIECQFDTGSRRLVGVETIDFKNESAKSIGCLALDWSVSTSQTLIITTNGKSVRLLADSGQTNTTPPLLFELPQILPPGKRITLTLRFSQSIPAIPEQDRITLTTWFPRLWWGFRTHDDFDVKVEAPSGYSLATSGRLDARSGKYHADHVATFGLFLGRGLQVAEANAGDVLVRCLFSERGEHCARVVLKTAVDAINFYRERFGFYPYRSLNIVPGFDQPVGGYPAATSLSVIHGEERMSEKPDIHWKWITAHEIGHMYWGEYVLEKDSPGWLWIGLGIYGDREYIRSGGLSLEMHRELMSRYVKGVKEHLNTTVAITPEQLDDIDFDFNNVVIHGKGFSIISALANYLGRETFDRIYLRCLKEFGGKRLGADEFQKVCEVESGESLEWFFNEWVRSNHYLSYQITAQKCVSRGGGFVSTISVERVGTMKMPVPVVAYFDDGSSQKKMTDRLSDANVLEFVSTTRLKRTQIDPDSELAMIVPPPEMTAPELTRAIEGLPWTGAGKKAAAVFSKAQELKPTGENIWFKLGLMLYDGEYYQQALEAFQRTAEISRDSSVMNFGALVWQGHIFDILGKRDMAVQKYRLAQSEAAGQELHHSQYDMVVNQKWVEERLQKAFVRK